MSKLLVLIAAAGVLAGCAARHAAPVEPAPAPPIPGIELSALAFSRGCLDYEYWHKNISDHSRAYSAETINIVAGGYERCQELKQSVDYAERLMDAAWAVQQACAHDTVHDCETPGHEFAARKKEWLQLDDKYRGISRYSCPDGWALVSQTCWAFRPITESDMAMTLKDGAICHFTLADSGQCLCEKPANK